MGQRACVYDHKRVVQEHSAPVLLGVSGRAHSDLASGTESRVLSKISSVTNPSMRTPTAGIAYTRETCRARDVSTFMESKVLTFETCRTN